jgi:hypothetical protein
VKLCQPEGGTLMKVSENRVLKRKYEPDRVEAIGGNFLMKSVIICTLRQILIG